MPDNLRVFLAHPEAVLPDYKTGLAACFDLSIILPENEPVCVYLPNNTETKRLPNPDRSFTIYEGERVLLRTGLMFDIPCTHSMRVHIRSGSALKDGLFLANGQGIIDADYIQEVKLIVSCIGKSSVVKHRSRIAQGELRTTVLRYVEQMTTPPLPKTNRSGGFGSTGS